MKKKKNPRSTLGYKMWLRTEKYKKKLRNLLFTALALILFGVLGLAIFFSGSDADNSYDRYIGITRTVDGTFKEIKRKSSSSYRSVDAFPDYIITISESNEKYVLYSVPFRNFKYKEFVSKMKPGMPITLVASNKEKPLGFQAYAVSAADFSFISVEDSIEAFEENAQSALQGGTISLAAGLIMGITGLILYIRA